MRPIASRVGDMSKRPYAAVLDFQDRVIGSYRGQVSSTVTYDSVVDDRYRRPTTPDFALTCGAALLSAVFDACGTFGLYVDSRNVAAFFDYKAYSFASHSFGCCRSKNDIEPYVAAATYAISDHAIRDHSTCLGSPFKMSGSVIV